MTRGALEGARPEHGRQVGMNERIMGAAWRKRISRWPRDRDWRCAWTANVYGAWVIMEHVGPPCANCFRAHRIGCSTPVHDDVTDGLNARQAYLVLPLATLTWTTRTEEPEPRCALGR
jgi:hypothetical protein